MTPPISPCCVKNSTSAARASRPSSKALKKIELREPGAQDEAEEDAGREAWRLSCTLSAVGN
jgi:hypothetical protein